jgi:hypothetical protein
MDERQYCNDNERRSILIKRRKQRGYVKLTSGVMTDAIMG